MTDKQIKQFIKDRNEAVWSLDIEKFSAYLKKYFPPAKCAEILGKGDEFVKGMMAKMAFNIIDTPEDVIEKARKILTVLGWSPDIY